MKRLAFAVAAAFLASACTETQPLRPPASGGPAALIMDGAHNNGNPNFFFLPPLVADPTGSPNFDAGRFNPNLSPTVEACELTGDPRLGSVECRTNGLGDPVLVFGPVQATLDQASEHYRANWDTRSPVVLDPTKFYRILVRGAPRADPLGVLDADPVDLGMKNVRTGEVVQFQDGRTLPISMRIEDGAFGATDPDHVEQVVRNVATVVTTNTGFAGASFPDEWLPLGALEAGITQVVVIIERIPLGEGTHCLQTSLSELEGCYRFRTDPDLHAFGVFDKLVTAGVCLEVPLDDPDARPFELHRRGEVDGTPTGPTVTLPSAPAPFLTCDRFTATPPSGSTGALGSRGILDLASAGWQALVRGVGHLLKPRALYAVDLGAGGSTDGFSRFGWAAPLIDCAAVPGGDQLSRGFYIPGYPGTSLDRVDLFFSARAAGTYRISLSAHAGSYDGPVIGVGTADVALSGDDQANVETPFEFFARPVVQGSTVAFTVNQVSGPSEEVFFATSNAESCPVVETEDTSPPLSTPRFGGRGVGIRVHGSPEETEVIE